MNYYNENDPKAAEWLRQLIEARLIPFGLVDDRSIHDVTPADLRNFRQCHFFAGIGGWPYALTIAGVCPTREIWTASCPCQPFSTAGKGKGTADHRHLWPVFSRLVAACRPAIAFGEQVASKAGRDWFAGIRSDLEGMGYEVGGADLCAAGIGAPHIRQRLFWVAYANGNRRDQGRASVTTPGDDGAFRNGGAGRLADPAGLRRPEQREEPREEPRRGAGADDAAECARPGGLDHAQRGRRGAVRGEDAGDVGQQPDPTDCDGGRLGEQALGAMPSCCDAPTAKRGVLNPEFSRWLMGYPGGWGFCGDMAMRLCRRSPRSSSRKHLQPSTSTCNDTHDHDTENTTT